MSYAVSIWPSELRPVNDVCTVIQAFGLPLVRFGKLPKAYAEICIGDFRDHTEVHEPSRDPAWNEEFKVPVYGHF